MTLDENSALPVSFSAVPMRLNTGCKMVHPSEYWLTKSSFTRSTVKRSAFPEKVVPSLSKEKASGSCISTTGDALAELFGSTNVTATTASVVVNLSASDLPPVKAYLFVMKDGDDLLAFGCSEGQISVSDNVSFQAGEGIAWPFEITAQGTTGMQFVKVNG